MDDNLVVATMPGDADWPDATAIDALLAEAGLTREPHIDVFAVAYLDRRLVGCLGLDGGVVKCAAIAESIQGFNVLGRLFSELRCQALLAGHVNLRCYTKPSYRRRFEALGFTAIAEVPKYAVLLEDDPSGITDYAAGLATTFRPGKRIGGVVMNANPFTYGHRYLLEAATAYCDVVHVFVVGEDVSRFSYAQRFRMVSEGVQDMPQRDQLVVHPGSPYVVSRSTFPQYFLHDSADVTRAYTGIDLQIFRRHIATALGIRHRFLGTEPTSQITAEYNRGMGYWLREAPEAAPPISVHEIQRVGDPPISASRVRRALDAGRWDEIAELVPPTTAALLWEEFTPPVHPTKMLSPVGSFAGVPGKQDSPLSATYQPSGLAGANRLR
ncbi:MAG: [citrate (pro-3S)-lyase] ligase [Propionibacteriaceae bacterium]|jgi:[citrate (pro-3S)-lyase] ligase|nr:[citrate (pro-3S)-lyase] ligase [Propionibacteriaceae bacterium]